MLEYVPFGYSPYDFKINNFFRNKDGMVLMVKQINTDHVIFTNDESKTYRKELARKGFFNGSGIQGIPLDSMSLEALGFTCINEEIPYYRIMIASKTGENSSFRLMVSKRGVFFRYTTFRYTTDLLEREKELKFVHELQNLIYDLVEGELIYDESRIRVLQNEIDEQ